ncbi:copper resistance protein B [Variovorax sp. NFACC27]|nr:MULTISPECIES: copper resistance protein B [Variovorax]SEF19259.1 copper resistance protein B [Variovorax sp. NFACC28]SEF75248.1 copper resistance protein B [Variovorax sp. NFACC29]SFB78880.1 copper resistance protein B [Variovorax sp. NFACC26]SFG78026.1 copper resistance protein B [Variovorax sp. NFACC27]MDN6887832.1 copper resistance protein B [Variovorax sp. CAN15]
MNPLQLKLARSSIAVATASFLLGFTVSAIAQSDASKRMDDMPGMGANMSDPTSKGGASNKVAPTSPSKELTEKNNPRSTAAPMDLGQVQGMPGMKGGSSDMKDMPGMNMGSMPGMGPMQGGTPPPDARNPDAHAEGMPKMAMPGMDMADDERFGRILVNELEYAKGRDARGQNLNVEAWYGGDYNKLWIKAEGERRAGRLDAFRTEALWDHAIATFWSTQLGLRHDNGGGGRSRSWLAFGVQGLAPYWFETEATAYVGSGGALAARLELRYDLLLTQKWILQPKLEANFYSKSDPQRGIGSGLSDMELGVRLRYEVTRQLAPFIGVTWSKKFGNTAAYARQAGERVRDTQIVAGVRLWF